MTHATLFKVTMWRVTCVDYIVEAEVYAVSQIFYCKYHIPYHISQYQLVSIHMIEH